MSEFRFKYYRLTPEEKEALLKRVRKFLSGQEDVLLAVVFGSFNELDSFRDLDVAVYLSKPSLNRVLQLADELEEEVGVPVDVVPLTELPPRFRHYVLVKGRVILEKRPGLYEALLSQTADELNLVERQTLKREKGR